MVIKADLHIHTCLSPCADVCMVPSRITRHALEQGLRVIAICDHNTAQNVAAVRQCAQREGLLVLGGMEITSREEVHMLGYFRDDETLLEAQAIIAAHLTGENDRALFGEQWVVDEHDCVVECSRQLLIGATTLSVEDIVRLVHRLGGAVIASHVDREAFGIIGQLGFVPPNLDLDGLEVSTACDAAAAARFREFKLPLVRCSDAHLPDDIGRACTWLSVNDATVEEALLALRGRDGRGVSI